MFFSSHLYSTKNCINFHSYDQRWARVTCALFSFPMPYLRMVLVFLHIYVDFCWWSNAKQTHFFFLFSIGIITLSAYNKWHGEHNILFMINLHWYIETIWQNIQLIITLCLILEAKHNKIIISLWVEDQPFDSIIISHLFVCPYQVEKRKENETTKF